MVWTRFRGIQCRTMPAMRRDRVGTAWAPFIVAGICALVAGCDSSSRNVTPSGPTTSGDVAVASTRLEQQTDDSGGSLVFDTGCHLLGTIVNQGTRDQNVEVTFNVLGKNGVALVVFPSPADTGPILVPAGGKANFRVVLGGFAVGVQHCDDVKQVTVQQLVAKPA